MRKHYAFISVLTLAVAFVIGCGVHSTNGGGGLFPKAFKPVLGTQLIPGGALQIHRNSTLATSTLPGPLKYMATFIAPMLSEPSIPVVMSFNGLCDSIYTFPDVEFKIPGLGDNQSKTCGNNMGTPLPTDGSPVAGDGTLSSLYVFGDYPVPSLYFKVYINGVVVPGFTCNFNGQAKCHDIVTTAPVKDSDRVSVTLTADAASTMKVSNIIVMLGKS